MSERAKLILKAMFNAFVGKVEYPDILSDENTGLLFPEFASLRQALTEALALETALEKRVKEQTKIEGRNSSVVAGLKEELKRQRELTRKIRENLRQFEDPEQRAMLLANKVLQARNAARANGIATGPGANVAWDHPFSELEEDLIWARKELARAVAFELELGDSLELMKQTEEPDSPRITSLQEKVELQREEVAEIRRKVKMLEQLFEGINGTRRQETEDRQPDPQALDFQMFACIAFLVLIVLLAIWKIYR